MKHLPSFSAKPQDPFLRRSQSERNEQYETQISRHDETPFRQVGGHLAEREELVQPDISDEMQGGVIERKQSDHSSKPDEASPSSNLPERTDAQRQDQKAKRPDSS